MKLSPLQLSNIADKISSGKILFALFTANEYLAPEDPIRRALVFKAKKQVNFEEISLSEKFALDKAFSGSRAEELPSEIRENVFYSESMTSVKKLKVIPFPNEKREYVQGGVPLRARRIANGF